jgi:hypothetical protein
MFLARVWRREGSAAGVDIFEDDEDGRRGVRRSNLYLFSVSIEPEEIQPRRSTLCAMRSPPFNNGRVILCEFAGCGHCFFNRSGLTKHVRTHHKYSFPVPQPIIRVATLPPDEFDRNLIDFSSSPPPMHDDFDVGHHVVAVADPPCDDQSNDNHRQPIVELHPFLNGLSCLSSPHTSFVTLGAAGQPCDKDGNILPPGTPPVPRVHPPPTDWTPFRSRIEFETAEFLFKKDQMSAGGINELMGLWAASNVKFGGLAPFKNCADV